MLANATEDAAEGRQGLGHVCGCPELEEALVRGLRFKSLPGQEQPSGDVLSVLPALVRQPDLFS